MVLCKGFDNREDRGDKALGSDDGNLCAETFKGRIKSVNVLDLYSGGGAADNVAYIFSDDGITNIICTDDFAAAFVRLEGGIILDFRIAWYMHLDTPGDTIIMGTKGSLRVPSTDCWNGTFDKPITIYHDVAGKPVQTEIPLIHGDSNLFDKKIRSFLDAVITGGKAPVPTSQIIYNQAIIDGIFRSNESGHEVEIKIPEI